MNASDDTKVSARLDAVRARIAAAEARFGREPGSVALLAVSKLQPAALIRAASEFGQLAFGESYVQEACDKQTLLADLALDWHFIGRIQSNKTKQITEHFSWVHGLGDVRHARRLGEQRIALGLAPLRCCLQVNLSGEASKAGVEPPALPALLKQCAAIEGLRIEGLMTLPAPADSLEAQRQPFAELRALRDQLATPEQPLTTLSMGMSDDLEAAVAEGATMVRIGTAVFGPRRQH
ncbi:MAG: YggS family pyridoxal phosphate-dependent enzyme [Lamprobacter sp.]|uniref:YggS family pyridoxal phosphate-dependent enzyme n=1 Tax=Lamprobacter sp. TaxID=3100796 RepID=UPI002B258C9F|nr:YggS family pyridoxal phosphate-dependent enzyme [Lamprobacter sp.]MEA3643744.1 YggS family pyridoxal phosphate-dependent enzyme [Lamprobacter sp.]